MELLVYKASAGSGKTFTLAVEYIKHLILDPRAYRQILAVTFTNKATAEMKERIIQQLYGIWKGLPASDPYLQSVKQKMTPEQTLTDTDIRRNAGQALQYILHDYSRFRVETIDSFFQSVMRNLARELDLSPMLNIELNNASVLSDAVDSLMEKLTPTSPVLAWLLDYIQEKINSDKRWNVAHEIKQFGRNIFHEGYIERGEALRYKLDRPEAVRLYKETLQAMLTEALEQMKGFYDQFVGELELHNLGEEDLAGKSKGISSYFKKLNLGRLADKDVMNATLQKHLNSADNWAAKTSGTRKEVIRLAETSLLPLLEEAEKMRPKNLNIINSCNLSMQHLSKLQLLNYIDEEVRLLNRQNNKFLLSDTNALLHRLVGEGDSSFVFEKLGASIRNVMIDEFQDTSRMQWENFRFLLMEGLSQGADSLIVGDVKQSIYRWRNGDWGILNNLRDNTGLPQHTVQQSPIPFPTRVETLKVNRRSEARIIRFNNKLFVHAVEYLNQLHRDELKEECIPLLSAYSDVAQESVMEREAGTVKVTFVEEDEASDYNRLTIEALGNEVEGLLAQGVAQNEIAILVRKNKSIPDIAHYFEKELQLTIVSDEAFRLDASQAVNMLIDALKFLVCPDDSISRQAIRMAYQGMEGEEELPADFTGHLPELRLLPLYELLEELYRIFGISRMENQEAYLFCFFDAVTEYLQTNSSEIESFLNFWEENLSAKNIASSALQGIRIFSIHKSKGLEFHTVLLPYCDWKLENETNNELIWCAPPIEPYNALDLVPVNYSGTMADSVYRADYLHERLQLWVDHLNLLYVALTRASKNLIIWGKKGQKGTMSELLYRVLPQVAADGLGEWDEEAGVYTFGELYVTPADKRQAPDSDHSPNKLAVKPAALPVSMESQLHTVEFKQSNRSADFIAGVDEQESDQRFINRGRLLHTIFSGIDTMEDIDTAIDRWVFEGVIGETDAEEEIRTIVHRAFGHPQIAGWYDGSWQLYSERDVIWMDNGVLRNKRPDRVMMRQGEIVVIDFKFGKPHARYNRQVKDYMQLLARMGYDPAQIKGYLWYISPSADSGETDQWVEVC